MLPERCPSGHRIHKHVGTEGLVCEMCAGHSLGGTPGLRRTAAFVCTVTGPAPRASRWSSCAGGGLHVLGAPAPNCPSCV